MQKKHHIVSIQNLITEKGLHAATLRRRSEEQITNITRRNKYKQHYLTKQHAKVITKLDAVELQLFAFFLSERSIAKIHHKWLYFGSEACIILLYYCTRKTFNFVSTE